MRSIYFAILFTLTLAGGGAYAACTSPAGEAGGRDWFTLSKNYKMCDGTNWNAFKTAGVVAGGCAGLVGRMDYDGAQTSYKICDNTNYIKVTPTCSPTLSYASKYTDATNLAGATWLALSTDGKRAFAATTYSAKITVLDISGSPAAPTLLGTSASITGMTNVQGIGSYGNYIFVAAKGASATGTGKLISINATTNTPVIGQGLAAPVVAEWDHIMGVAVSSDGKYAFTTGYGNNASAKCWVHAVDISNPASMTVVGKLNVTDNGGSAIYCDFIKVRGNTAYLSSDAGAMLTTTDISDPKLLFIKGQVSGVNNMQGIDISKDGNNVFGMGFAADKMNIFNVSNPSSPTYVASTAVNAAYDDSYFVKVINSSVALVSSDLNNSVAVINISTPAAPTVTQTYTSAGNLNDPYEMQVYGRYAYVADSGVSGVVVLDMGCDPQPVTSQGACGTAGILEYFPTTKALAYCSGSAYTVIAQADVVPGNVDWADFLDESQLNSIFDIGSTIDLQLSYVNTTGTPTVQYRKNGGSWTTFTTGSPASVNMTNADTLEFKVSGTTGHKATITVSNTSDNGTVLDTMVGTVDYDYYLYTPNYGASSTINVHKRNIDGSLTAVSGSPFTGPGTAYSCWADSQGKFLYVTSYNGDNIYGYNINQSTGAVGSAITGSPWATIDGPRQVIITDDNKWLYTGSYGNQGIGAFSVNQSTGALTAITGQPFASLSAIADVKNSPDNKFLYVAADANTSNVSGYSINQTTGALTALGGFPITPGRTPQTIAFAVTGSGTFLYTSNWGDNNIGAYSVNTTTGALTSVAGMPFTTGTRPNSVAADPLGKMLLSANSTANTITAFKITAATGVLTTITGLSFAGNGGWDIAADPGGKYFYSVNQTGNNYTGMKLQGNQPWAVSTPSSPYATGAGPQAGAFAKVARP